MIKSDRQLGQARDAIRNFEAAVAAHNPAVRPEGVDEGMHRATLAASRGMLERLRDEVADYEALKRGDLGRIEVRTLDDVPSALIRTRIARGLTQKALAARLDVAEQQVQRWEQQDYENAGFSRLLEVADALEFDILGAALGAREREAADAVADARVERAAGRPPIRVHGYEVRNDMPAWPQWETEAGFDPGRLLPLLQKANTFNQTAIVQFCYIAGGKHQKLKDAWRDKRPKREILERYIDLLSALNHAFEIATAHNVRFLRTCFLDRGASPPRICLKGNLQANEEDRIVSLFRAERVDYDSGVRVQGNTGFASIAQSGSYYVENNLPAAALQRKYVNPRLDVGRIRATFGRYSPERAAALSQDWPLYWNDFSPEKDSACFYRSTLIMPLKLWDNQISPQFQNELVGKSINRTIFGYLCMDHSEVDYFNPPVDLNISKMFADALCTLVLLRLNFTTHSNTVKAVRRLPEVALWEASDRLSPARPSLRARRDLENRPLFGLNVQPLPELKTRSKPDLFEVDTFLLSYLQAAE